MNIQSNIFDLTQEQEDLSKMMYSGKVVKFLITPYHNYNELEKVIPFTKTTFLLPEREMTAAQVRGFVSMIVTLNTTDEIIVVTVDQNIILDMVDSCVRILTEDGDIVACPIKTFMANIHDIRYSIFENDAFKSKYTNPKPISMSGKERTQDLLERLRKNQFQTISKTDKKILEMEVNMIGEDVIRNVLSGYLDDINTY